MAKVKNVVLGGKSKHQYSSVAFLLSKPVPVNKIYTFEESGCRWEVELEKGGTMATARADSILRKATILSRGHGFIQKALDLLSIQNIAQLILKSPEDNHVVLFHENGKLTMQHVDILSFGVNVSTKVTKRKRNGTIIPTSPRPEPSWHEAFRYYRLSQISKDLFEAYRNLYLSFESLLNFIYCKRAGEKEIDWLTKALTEANSRIDLGELEAFRPCPINAFINNQYKGVRLKLFHAKTNIILPHNELSLEEVDEAYKKLLLIWHKVASEYLNTTEHSTGGLTQAGFMNMVSPFKNSTLVYTDDSTPFSKEDTLASPLGRPVYNFTYNNYLGETGLFEAAFNGIIKLDEVTVQVPIYRICTMMGNMLAAVSIISDGLTVEDIDVFESKHYVKLIK